MKEALKSDRARIQVGRISSFGLMEMSRQRLRTGVLEASTKPCPHCEGTGLMRTAASAGLSALRIIEDEATRGRGDKILLRAGREAAVYVLNKKRSELADIEQRYGVSIDVAIDESFEGARMTVESSGVRPTPAPRAEIPPIEDEDEALDDEDSVEISLEGEDELESEGRQSEGERQGGRRRRRRRRGGRGRGRREDGEGEAVRDAEEPISGEFHAAEAAEPEASPEEAAPERGRRRRRSRKPAAAAEQAVVEPDSSPMVERPIDEEPPIAQTQPAEEAKPKRRRSKKVTTEVEVALAEPAPVEAPAQTAEDATPVKPARKRASKSGAKPAAEPVEAADLPAANNDTAAEGEGARRSGWWQRTFG
jgi:ribonuclease E